MIKEFRQLSVTSKLIIATLFFVSTGTYFVTPFYAVSLSDRLGITTLDIGILLAAGEVSQRGLAYFAGYFTDRFRPRIIMVAGLFLRHLSFVILAYASSFDALLVAALFGGSGAAMFQTAAKVALVELGGSRVTVLAMRNAVINAGAAIGPVLGGGLIYTEFEFSDICILVSLIYLASLVIFMSVLRSYAGNYSSATVRFELFSLLSTRKLWHLYFAQCGVFFFMTQLVLVFPVYGNQQYGLWMVTATFWLNATIVSLFQLRTMKLAKRVNATLDKGFVLIGIGFLVISGSSSFENILGIAGFLFGVALFSISEVFLTLTTEVDATAQVDNENLGQLFGALSFVAMIGALTGNIVLGWAYEQLGKYDVSVFWWVVACVAFAFFLAIRYIGKVCNVESCYDRA